MNTSFTKSLDHYVAIFVTLVPCIFRISGKCFVTDQPTQYHPEIIFEHKVALWFYSQVQSPCHMPIDCNTGDMKITGNWKCTKANSRAFTGGRFAPHPHSFSSRRRTVLHCKFKLYTYHIGFSSLLTTFGKLDCYQSFRIAGLCAVPLLEERLGEVYFASTSYPSPRGEGRCFIANSNFMSSTLSSVLCSSL